MTPPRLNPFREPRLWATFLWALTLAVGIAWVDWGLRRMEAAAEALPVVLVAADPLTDEQRREARVEVERDPSVARADWRSPGHQIRNISDRFSDPSWRELVPGDQAWLPWVLEVRPHKPLGHPARLRAFVATCRKQPRWGVVLWSPERFGRLLRGRRILLAASGFGLALVLLSGVGLLLCLPWPRRGGGWLWVLQAMLGLLAPATVWLAAHLAGAPPDARGLGLSAGLGFLLACLVAPVVRRPLQQPQRLSFMVAEEKNERQNTRGGD